MNVPIEWVYFAITIPFVVVWSALWLYAPHLRREQVRMSIAFAVIGVCAENFFYYKDYWRPLSVFPVDVAGFAVFPEALLFGATFGGIAAVIYRSMFRIHEQSRDSDQSLHRVCIAGGIFLVVSYALFFFGVNSIYAHACAAIVLAVYIAICRPDLRRMSLASGALMFIIMFTCYSVVLSFVANMEQFLATAWLLHGTLLDIRISGIPVSELLWSFSAGASVGVIRAYVKGIRYTT